MCQEPDISISSLLITKSSSKRRYGGIITSRLSKQSRKRIIRYSLVFGNIALLVFVSVFLLNNRSASDTVRRSTFSGAANAAAIAQNPLDQLSSAEIAEQTAALTGLPELVAVRNQADSENAQLAIVPSDSTIVAKPTIVSTAQRSKKSIIHYKSAPGDTLSSLAAKYGISTESIKYSNGLSAEAIPAGKDLVIPPANGIVYQVKSGDTADSISSRYQIGKDLFVTVNDAESGVLALGDFVWIPNGIQPAQVTRYSQTSRFAFGGFTAVYGPYNGYDYGYCTWYVANRRSAAGNPVPSNLGNASTWKVLAQRAGIPTGPSPRSGAVAWKVPYDYYGHVSYVEEVYADGSFKVSEMNTAGWARVSSQTVPAGASGSWYFIY